MPHKHQFFQGSQHPGYSVCLDCGTYKCTKVTNPEDVYGANYWSHENGRSTIDEQVYNVDVNEENGVTKNKFILDMIRTPKRKIALEIGCAPGILLKRLQEDAGFGEVRGIDVDPAYWPDIRRIAGDDIAVWFGFFPEESQLFANAELDLIVASDVFEHSPKPLAFMAECHRLLVPGGQLIVMAPILVPGVAMLDRMFNTEEHIYLHSERHMRSLASDAGLLVEGKLTRWAIGHECMDFRKATT